MDHVLPVQIGERGRDLRDEQPRLLVRQRQVGQPLVERGPGNALDHGVGLMREIAGAVSSAARGVPSAAAGSSSPSRRRRSPPGPRPRTPAEFFISSGTSMPGMGDGPQRRHAAGMDAFADGVAVDDGAGFDQGFRHRPLAPLRQPVGEPVRQAVLADPVRRARDVIGRAAIRDLARDRVEQHEGCRRIAVAGLADRSRARPAIAARAGAARRRRSWARGPSSSPSPTSNRARDGGCGRRR